MTLALDLEIKDTTDDLDAIWPSDEERARLEAILQPYYVATLHAVNTVVAGLLSQVIDPASMIVDDAATNRILAEAASRVVRIDEATRVAIAQQLQIGQLRGYSTWQIAHGVPDDGYRGIDGLFQETWAGRADTIARTELQHAQLVASRDRYLASGVVDRVRIIDGDEWDTTCSSRNGQVVPIEQAPTLAHPNCTLVLIPVLRGAP